MLTPTGDQLLNEIEPAYQRLQEALTSAREAATVVSGTLRIGTYAPGGAGRHMVDIVRSFQTRHPPAEVVFVNTGWERDYRAALRDGEVDMLAIRLPLTDPDITIGPVLSRERRVLLVAKHDPLGERESVTVEDFAGRPVPDVPAFPREMMDAFIPPVSPSGRMLRRVVNRNTDEMVVRVAIGEQVHPTVGSFLEYYGHPDVTSVPISDLPPSETALAWLTVNRSPKIEAFARVAADVLAQTDL